MAWSYPFPFDPQGDFLCMSNISLVSKEGGSGDPSIFYSNRVLSLFVLAMTVTLRCLQETGTDYLSCFCCYFHFRANQQTEG